MRSKTSFFNGALYVRALRRWWPLGLALCAAMAYQCLGTVQGPLPMDYGNPGANLLDLALVTPLPAIFACAAAMLAYRYLHATRHAAFMAALPVERQAIFLSQGAAALTLLLAAEALCVLIVTPFSGLPALVFPAMGRWLAVTATLTTAYFGFASLCAVLTGHSLAVPALYALGLYAAVALESSVRNMAQFLIFGLGSQQWKLTALSPVYYLQRFRYQLVWSEVAATDPYSGQILGFTVRFGGWGTVIGYLAAGLLCLGIAAALLSKRPNEAAGDVIAVRVLRPVFRSGAALAGACAAGMLLLRTILGYSGYSAETGSGPKVLLLFFMLLLGGFVGWFGAEMLLRKSVRVFDRHWLGYGVFAAVVTVLLMGCELDLLGVERYIPAEEKIGFVNLNCYEAGVYDTRFEQPENIAAVRALHRSVVENKVLFEQDSDPRYASAGMGYYNPYGYTGGTLVLRYYDKSGALLMTREYTAPAGEMAWASNGDSTYTGGRSNPGIAMLEALANTPEAVEQRCLPGEGMTLSPVAPNWGNISYAFQDAMAYYRYGDLLQLSAAETYEFYTRALLPDLRESSLGALRLQPGSRQTLPEPGNVSINVSLGSTDGEQWWYWFGRLTPDARRTVAWLRDHGVELDAAANYVGPVDEEELGW